LDNLHSIKKKTYKPKVVKKKIDRHKVRTVKTNWRRRGESPFPCTGCVFFFFFFVFLLCALTNERIAQIEETDPRDWESTQSLSIGEKTYRGKAAMNAHNNIRLNDVVEVVIIGLIRACAAGV
jgi:hypothetical protein